MYWPKTPNFSKFIQVLKRLQLILPLNGLRNVTLFAPSNRAIEEYEEQHGSFVHANRWGWHWPWWPGGGDDESRPGGDNEPEDPLPQIGLEYHGITDTQVWYHIAIDGIFFKEGDFDREHGFGNW